MLCISASSAPSQRVFDCGSNIVTHKRCNSSPDTVNVLATLKENFDMIDWGLDRNEKETIVQVTKEKISSRSWYQNVNHGIKIKS
jgi:hypothetical protein